jgi:hypothetical protein
MLPLIATSDIVIINGLTLILKIIGHCDVTDKANNDIYLTLLTFSFEIKESRQDI